MFAQRDSGIVVAIQALDARLRAVEAQVAQIPALATSITDLQEDFKTLVSAISIADGEFDES